MKTTLSLCLLAAFAYGQTPFTISGTVTITYANGTTATVSGAVTGTERTESANGHVVSGSAHAVVSVGPCDWVGAVTAAHVDPVTGARTYSVTFSCNGARVTATWIVGHPAGDAAYVSYGVAAGHGFGTAWW